MRRGAFIRKVAAVIKRHGMAEHGEHILVAVSGGPDSVGLLAVLDALAAQWLFRLTVAHLDHGLRGADGVSDREFVEALAQRLGHPCLTETASIGVGGNLEARAREVRYRFLDRAARLATCGRIALGHTQTDQAETVLLRLLRGAGARGLGGMAPRRGRIIRPLLETSREDILTFLHERHLPWVEDKTNRDERFARNRLRHRLLPALVADAGPTIVAGLARTAELLRVEDDFLDDLARQALGKAPCGHPLEAATVRSVPLAIRRRILRLWLVAARGSFRGISHAHICSLERALEETETTVAAMPGGRVRCEAGFLRWESDAEFVSSEFSTPVTPGAHVIRADLGWKITLSDPEPWTAGQPLPLDRWTAVFDYSRLPPALVLRSVRAGDRIRPMGLGGTQKLQDVFVNAKVPSSARKIVPLLAAGPDVLWVPGLSRSVIAMVTETTTAVVWARFQRLG